MRAAVLSLCLLGVSAGSSSAWPPAAYVQAAATLAQMTVDEMIRLVSGDNAEYSKNCTGAADPAKNCAYVGWQHGVPRLGLADIYMEDGPQGVADGMRGVTMFPGIQTLAQAWDAPLARAMGAAMGAEQRAKGSSVMLGPAVALIRCPLSGRNFEYISEDPALNAALAAALVAGVQAGTNVSACVKHWIFNSQETNRSGMSSHVAERVGRELYEPPYAAAVDAGVGFVMCSFNRINGSVYSCANGAGLNAWLKQDLGFDGAVVSDWGATHGTADFALGGLDIEQEWARNSTFFGAALAACVANGSVPMARLRDMAVRSLRAAYALGFAGGAPSSANASAAANATAHARLAADVARASLVLLKNEGGALPLRAAALPRGVAVFGQDAVVGGGGSGQVVAPYLVRARDGIAAALPGVNVTYLAGNRDELAAGAVAALARAADVAVVVVAVGGGEGSDRANLSASCAPWAGPQSCTWWPDQDALVAAVAAANPVTVVVTRTPGAVLMPWLGAVRAVVHQGFPGQEAGTALGEALAGALNPRGRLTISFPRTLNDTWLSGAGGGPILPQRWPGVQLPGDDFATVSYDEGFFVGYRWYDSQPSSPPLFPFGFGLSFSTFAYSDLAVTGAVGPNASATVTARIAHVGGPAGAELAQLYVAGALPGDPAKALKGWARAELAPGAAQTVSFTLTARDLTLWDATAHAHVPFPSGSYALWVGASAADLRLAGAVEVRA